MGYMIVRVSVEGGRRVRLAKWWIVSLALLLSVTSVLLGHVTNQVSLLPGTGSSATPTPLSEIGAIVSYLSRGGSAADIFASTTSTNVAMITGFNGLSHDAEPAPGCAPGCSADD